jgi:hypothetical protein
MQNEVFSSFRLVGGTALSLQLGHRKSVDIDLFCDLPYGEISFEEIDDYLLSTFSIVDFSKTDAAIGRSYFVGNDKSGLIKLDVFYTDKFIFPFVEEEGIRMATLSEIAAMKVDVIQRIGRKKDFWDLHELLKYMPIEEMINLHQLRYPYNHSREHILGNFVNFNDADDDFNPICLHGKYWEFIKSDFEELIKPLQ